MKRLGFSRTFFKQLLEKIDMDKHYKNLLYDKYYNNIKVKDLQQMYHLSKSSIYYNLQKAQDQFNERVSELKDTEFVKFLESFRKFL